TCTLPPGPTLFHYGPYITSNTLSSSLFYHHFTLLLSYTNSFISFSFSFSFSSHFLQPFSSHFPIIYANTSYFRTSKLIFNNQP
ncbi:hypothetical protein VIGAN_01329700, partial [Vigna angularis var. angularis]